ncbi:hypothetical protein B5V01_00655 [Mesorhizobium erdmanii]|uniref:Uncharacterized protein n=1 Tax=Mesorhizobium erdmanii TaxID=1777866 RepID=A0A4Q1VK03_9HYPH|nr:hypothetical protein B5V01_00655 [Mesorhizobium erdmanii]
MCSRGGRTFAKRRDRSVERLFRGIPAVLVEIRQDLLANRSGIEEWADRLAAALPAHETETVS